MLSITVFILFIVLSSAQLQITPQTTLDVLFGALMGLGLPNATEFLTSDERQAASQAANSTTEDGCLLACNLLRDVLNLNNSLPHNYNPALEYWAQQQQNTLPSCFVTPGTAPYVAAAVLVLEYFRCPFAVKSAGSSPFGSNIRSPGVVIDMRTFRTIALSRDRKVVTLGTGQDWGTVIDGMGIIGYMVPAAYSASIGVGGYLLNGGISFASGRYGLAADNVVRFEVVTANGSILNATPNENVDLYWALRGGGATNFGIVTQFDLSTFPVPPQFWGGLYSVGIESTGWVLEAFEDFVHHKQEHDDGAQLVCAMTPSGMQAVLSHLDGRENSSSLQGILAIPSTGSSLKVRTMSDLAREIDSMSPRSNRQLFHTFTAAINASWMVNCSEHFLDSVSMLQSLLEDRMLDPRLSFELLSPAIIEKAADNGGNPLGLESMSRTIVVHLGLGWFEERDDPNVELMVNDMIDRCVSLADAAGALRPLVYPGYAGAGQNVVAGLEAANQQRLRSVAEAYDHDGWLR